MGKRLEGLWVGKGGTVQGGEWKRVRVEKEEGVGKRAREGLELGKRWKGYGWGKGGKGERV